MASSSFKRPKMASELSSSDGVSGSEEESQYSDYSQRKLKKKQTALCHPTSYKVSVATVAYKYMVNFVEWKDLPTFPHLKDSTVKEIINFLLDFTTDNLEGETSNLVEDCKRNSNFSLFFRNEGRYLNIDMKTCGKTQLDTVRKLDETNLCESFVKAVYSIYNELVIGGQKNDQVNTHKNMRSCIEIIGNLTGYVGGLTSRNHGKCERTVTVRVKTRSRGDRNTEVTAKPDYVFGYINGSEDCIPVEIATTEKFSLFKKSNKKSQDTSRSSSSSSSGIINSLDGVKNLSSCLPQVPYEGEPITWNHKSCADHLMQLMAIAEEWNIRNPSPTDLNTTYTIHGIYTLNEYLFFSKMQVGKYYLDHKLADHIPASFEDLFEDMKPKISFFPAPLDITISKHRLALLCFFRSHYRNHFTDRGLQTLVMKQNSV